ncbi:MAG: GNAT family N-acetyltransferase [Mesorhizobium sp.]
MSTDPHEAVEYREAVEKDFGAVAHVWREGARSALGPAMEPPSVDELRARIDGELASGWVLPVAVRSGSVVGFLALKPRLHVLDQLFVLPSAQGQGIGTALLDRAKREMPGGFRLRTAAINEKARRFYVRSGLSFLGEGIHPKNGTAVCHYGWSVAKD